MKIKTSQQAIRYHRFVIMMVYFLNLKNIQKQKSYQIISCKCPTKKENYWQRQIKEDNSYCQKIQKINFY